MPGRGVAPTPTAILEARGSWRAKMRKGEPRLACEAPVCPRGLSAPAKQVWEQVVRDLRSMRVVARPDRNALERYCRKFVRWRILMAKIEAGTASNREVEEEQKLSIALLRLEQEFGLTPAARVRVQVPLPTVGEGPAPEFLSKIVG